MVELYFWLATHIPGIQPKHVIEDLFPNWPVLIAHVLASMVLLFFLTKWLYRPVKQNLKKRSKVIQDQITSARQHQLVAILHEKQAKERLLAVDKQRKLIFKQAILAAEKQKSQIVNTAHYEADLVRKKAETMIADERRQMAEQIRATIVSTAFAASQAVVPYQIDEKQHKMLVEKFIDNL